MVVLSTALVFGSSRIVADFFGPNRQKAKRLFDLNYGNRRVRLIDAVDCLNQPCDTWRASRYRHLGVFWLFDCGFAYPRGRRLMGLSGALQVVERRDGRSLIDGSCDVGANGADLDRSQSDSGLKSTLCVNQIVI